MDNLVYPCIWCNNNALKLAGNTHCNEGTFAAIAPCDGGYDDHAETGYPEAAGSCQVTGWK